MRKRLIGFVTLAAALAAAAVAVSSYRQQETADTTPRESDRSGSREGTSAYAKPLPASSATAAQTLERDNKIPRGSYKAVGPKAYEIVRGNEFRPPGDALAHVKQLMLRSESGDATATYEIYRTVEQCQTFISDRADNLADSAASVGSGNWFLERSERILKECESLALDQDIYHADWLSKAAAMGSQEAMRAYSLSPEKAIGSLDDAIRDPAKLEAWKETATGYLRELEAQGNVNVISDMAMAYTYGGIVPADPVAALAYTRVLNRLDPRFATTNDIATREKNLSSQQKENARLSSNEIFKNCCIPR
ncbi:hypothetical protein E5C33_04135 [Stenotrophomonas maltophilia]|uniref:hypothetical protein n=1 Tax=Stenotrophomonas maltophilia TaxID=40324 RepID=UPI001076A65E|nr:hypothetical protein [Stenotrophomonas maltophilia]TFZ46839.1 hypothetical protein E5C33_04135 [Stenotrophomonas maltophilia]